MLVSKAKFERDINGLILAQITASTCLEFLQHEFISLDQEDKLRVTENIKRMFVQGFRTYELKKMNSARAMLLVGENAEMLRRVQ